MKIPKVPKGVKELAHRIAASEDVKAAEAEMKSHNTSDHQDNNKRRAQEAAEANILQRPSRICTTLSSYGCMDSSWKQSRGLSGDHANGFNNKQKGT